MTDILIAAEIQASLDLIVMLLSALLGLAMRAAIVAALAKGTA